MFRATTRCLQALETSGSLTKAGIRNLLANPTWSIQDLLKESRSAPIEPLVLRKLLKLSGLHTEISAEKEAEVLRALKSQIRLIENLYDSAEEESQLTGENNAHFRLIPSDHSPETPLTLAMLKKSISEMRPDSEKGEGDSYILGDYIKIKKEEV